MRKINKIASYFLQQSPVNQAKIHYRTSTHALSQSHLTTLQHSNMSEIQNQNCSLALVKEPHTVFVQRDTTKGMMLISFNYDQNGKTRQFNLNRSVVDPLSTSIERIKLNIAKIAKKPKAKLQDSDDHIGTIGVDLLIDGLPVDPSLTNNGDAWIEGAILEVNGKPYKIRENSPQVGSMDLPTCIMKNFITIPMITTQNCDIKDCKFIWYRKISVSERDKLTGDDLNRVVFDGRAYWYRLSTELYYCPTEEDVAHFLKIVCHPTDGEKTGPEFSCVSRSPVELGPSDCPFEARHEFTKTKTLRSDQMRVVSYNILADLYADSDYSRKVLFGHCPSYALELEYRRQLLLKEISGYNADIICLQEVDKKEFYRAYEPFLKLFGDYSGVFNTKGGQVAEGQATFYRNEKYDCIDSHRILLSSLIDRSVLRNSTLECDKDTEQDKPLKDISAHPFFNDDDSIITRECLTKFDSIRSAIAKNLDLQKRFMERHTALQTTLLKTKDLNDTYIIVGNTHLYFAPDADHIRLLQGAVCVKYLEFIREFYKDLLHTRDVVNPKLSVILCGDMNSTPDCGLYKLVTEGRVPNDLPDWTSNQAEAVVGLDIETELRLSPAYKDINYTNYTMEFNGCLDYIYYDRQTLFCESVVPLPSHEDVTAIGGIPSDVFPSDHLALIANLKQSNSGT